MNGSGRGQKGQNCRIFVVFFFSSKSRPFEKKLFAAKRKEKGSEIFRFQNLFMVGLTRLDSNKYKTLMKYRKQFDYSPTSIGLEVGVSDNRAVDEFGEIAVKCLKQPYRRDFSDTDVEQIISSYQSGKSTIKLAKQFGCSKGTINKLLRQHGVEVIREKAQAKLDTAAVIAMYEEMRTSEEIAKQFKVHPQAVIRCLKANGVKIRTRWDYVKK